MIVALDRNEAVQRMSARGVSKISWSLKGLFVEWKYIHSNCARNWDGSSAGDGNDPDRLILQQMVWRDGATPRYSNFW